MANPDPYSNLFNQMTPQSTVTNNTISNKLLPKANFATPESIKQKAIFDADALKDKEVSKWENPEFNIASSLVGNALNAKKALSSSEDLIKGFGALKTANKTLKTAKTGSDIANNATKAAKQAKSAIGAAGLGLGVTAGKMALSAAGDKKISQAGMNEKEYMKGQWMKGLGTDNIVTSGLGTTTTAALNPVLSPIGAAAVGEAVTLAGNAVTHLIKKNKIKKDFQKSVADFKTNQAAEEQYNKDLAEQRRLIKGRANDSASYQGLMNNMQMYNPGSGNPILIAKKGIKIPVFRRGGIMDLEKENVILDGPSHDEHNNTGVKNDRGIPVVKKSIKVAEIESEELVLNKRASENLENLVKSYKSAKGKSKDEILNKIASITSREIKENTYDYTKELLD